MKLRCQRTILAAAFQAAAGVVPSRTPKDILKNLKLQIGDGKATLIGTDQEVGIRYELPEVETESAGAVLLPMQKMSAILREVQDDVIALEVTNDALWVRAGHSEFRLSVEDPAEFPDVPEFSEAGYHVLKSMQLRRGIQRTLFATDVESTRYALGGVLMEFRDESLTLAATDSRRLAVYEISSAAQGTAAEEASQPVVPSKAMSLLERSLHDAEEDSEVHIGLRTNDVIVRSGNVTIYSRLVQAPFPRYRDVIPNSSPITIDLVASPFLSAVRQAMIVTNEESRGVNFTFGDGTLTLDSQAADVGTSKVQLPVSYDDKEIVITFDPRFVADFLKVLDPSAAVQLRLIDSNSAAVFKAEDSYTYVVMPLSRE